jgi:5'-phosphate synthase pdxT subunit
MTDLSDLRIGVLAIQGAFAKHIEVLSRLGVKASEIRNASELGGIDGLIIPGGESTTMLKVMRAEGMIEPLRIFGEHHPVMGTCAGMILMATETDDARVEPFGWIPIRALRNAYGAQVHSFRDVGRINGIEGHPEIEMVFIRAPKFVPLSESIEILGTCRNEPVAARFGHHLALAFHPELTDDSRVHRMWLNGVATKASRPDIPVARTNRS